jgi:hypothetical protein
MISQRVFEQFNSIPGDLRMLCIDAAAVGCYLYQKGREAAGMKLLNTAITTAGLEPDLVQAMLNDPEKSFNALAMHVEIRALVNKISG